MSNKRILICVLTIVLVLLAVPVRRGAARTPVGCSPYCLYIGFNRLECHAQAEGGTGSYTFQWSPAPSSGGGEIAIVPCAPVGSLENVTVTVTDGNGATSTGSVMAYCGGRPLQ